MINVNYQSYRNYKMLNRRADAWSKQYYDFSVFEVNRYVHIIGSTSKVLCNINIFFGNTNNVCRFTKEILIALAANIETKTNLNPNILGQAIPTISSVSSA